MSSLRSLKPPDGAPGIVRAAARGNVRGVNIALRKGVNVSTVDDEGRCGLHYACLNGHHDVIDAVFKFERERLIDDMDSYMRLIRRRCDELKASNVGEAAAFSEWMDGETERRRRQLELDYEKIFTSYLAHADLNGRTVLHFASLSQVPGVMDHLLVRLFPTHGCWGLSSIFS